jgi:hypothetical protein
VYRTAVEDEFESIADEFRLDLSLGRCKIQCPVTNWTLRRPPAWAASLREYRRDTDIHIATWRKASGPLSGVGLLGPDKTREEYDCRLDGQPAKFTALRTWANGPGGAYVSMGLTRADESGVLSYTHNVAVVNLCCTISHAAAENAIGESLVLNADGTATEESIADIESAVNTQLQLGLLKEHVPGKGQRCSSVKYTMNRDDILNIPGAVANGVAELNLRGTIHSLNVLVKVR